MLLAQLLPAEGALPDVREPDVLLDDGDPVEGTPWRVVLTPGHTPGHICLVDVDGRMLFSGDHVLPTVFPGLGLGARIGGNPLAEYLDSLERLQPYDAFQVVPGTATASWAYGDVGKTPRITRCGGPERSPQRSPPTRAPRRGMSRRD